VRRTVEIDVSRRGASSRVSDAGPTVGWNLSEGRMPRNPQNQEPSVGRALELWRRRELNSEDRGESSEKQRKPPQSTQTSEAEIDRAEAERAAEFAARQTGESALEETDSEFSDLLAALEEHTARARVARVLAGDPNP